MRLHDPRPLLVAATILLLTGPVHAGGTSAWPNVDHRVAAQVRGVLSEAALRFGEGGCSTVLFDFDDARTGRPLAESLSRSGLDPSGWLHALYFVSGDGHAGCSDRRTLAYTPVGSPVVFICPAGFGKYRRAEPGFAATVVIHEALHTLGLAEEPGGSWAITLAVARRCGW